MKNPLTNIDVKCYPEQLILYPLSAAISRNVSFAYPCSLPKKINFLFNIHFKTLLHGYKATSSMFHQLLRLRELIGFRGGCLERAANGKFCFPDQRRTKSFTLDGRIEKCIRQSTILLS